VNGSLLPKKIWQAARKCTGDSFLTNIVSFHAQQAVEKSFKAVIEEFELGFIRTHDLIKLYEIVKNHLKFDVDLEMVKKLNELYVSVRYPGEFGLLPYGDPTIDDATGFYDFAKGVFEKVQDMLEQDAENLLALMSDEEHIHTDEWFTAVLQADSIEEFTAVLDDAPPQTTK
jgi:HEPN domain-containing protein